MATVLLNISMALGLALRSCGRKRTLQMGPLTLRPPDEPARLARCLFLSQSTITLYDGILTWLWQLFEEKKRREQKPGGKRKHTVERLWPCIANYPQVVNRSIRPSPSGQNFRRRFCPDSALQIRFFCKETLICGCFDVAASVRYR